MPLYVPRPLQAEISASSSRFLVAVIHRRYGKTVMAINWLIDGAEEIPDSFGYFVSPFKSQSKANCWAYLKFYGEPRGATFYKTDLIATFPNGSAIQLLGASDGWFDTHRGREAHRIAMDEVSQISPSAWRAVFRPMLADTHGKALFIGTPAGEDFFHELYQNGLNDALPQWQSWRRDVYETGIIDADEITALQEEMPTGDWQREFEVRFDVPPPGAFYGEQIAEVEIGQVDHVATAPVYTSWHFDDTDAATVLFWQIINGQRRIFDSAHSMTTTADDLAGAVVERPYAYERHYVAPGALTADTRGRFAAIRRAGVRLKKADKLPIIDSIYATKAALPKMAINESLDDLVVALRMYAAEYDEQLKVFSSRPVMNWCHSYCSAVAAFVTQHRIHTDWSKPLRLAGDPEERKRAA